LIDQHKQELPMEILYRLSGFRGFFRNWSTRNKNCLWQPCKL